MTHHNCFELRPVDEAELSAILAVYQQCEDFLALGPQPKASAEMVLQDIAYSHESGGRFCGLFNGQGLMLGIVDFIPQGFEGDPHLAFISLLMIAAPFRRQGSGAAVVQQIEAQILENPEIRAIGAGVQVNNPLALRFWQRNGYRIISGPEAQADGTTAYYLQKDRAGST